MPVIYFIPIGIHMKKIIKYTVTETDMPRTADGVVSLVLKRCMKLSPHEISSAKYTGDGITADGVQVTVKDRVHPGQLLSICLEDTADMTDHLLPVSGEVDILYEDEDLLAVNKPAGIVVHPTHGHYCDSIANIAAGYFSRRNENIICRVFGRLDKDTSGTLILAKNKPSAGRLEHQREQNIYRRTYFAAVRGTFPSDSGTVDAPIGPVPGTLMRQQVSSDGRPAVTHYEVLGTGCHDGLAYSCLRLTLDTGRTHQIRVHMAYIGHPLLGDPIYSSSDIPERYLIQSGCHEDSPHRTPDESGLTRTALHAGCLDLIQPFSGQPLHIEAPFPPDIEPFFCQTRNKPAMDISFPKCYDK